MEDQKLANRQDSYRKCNFAMVETREKMNLTLRKQTIEEYILKKRMKISLEVNSPLSLEINPEQLDIAAQYRDFRISNLGNNLEIVCEMLTSTNLQYQKFAVYLLRNYFLINEANNQRAIEESFLTLNKHNILQLLLDLLSTSTDNSLIFEIYWIFINMPLKNIENILNLEAFCEDQLIDLYIKHIRSQYSEIVENTVWFLCNIVPESTVCRDKIISSNIYHEIINILKKERNSADQIERCICFLSSIIKCKDTTPPKEKLIEILQISANYLHTNDMQIINQCLWCIYYVSAYDEGESNISSEILKSGAVVKLLKINYKKLHICITPCVRILGNLCAGKFDIVDTLLDMHILDFFDSLINFLKNPPGLREIVWAVCNITAGNLDHCTRVVDSHIFLIIIEFLTDNDYRLRKESLTAINNLSSASFELTLKIISLGVFRKFCEVLESEKNEVLISLTLDTIFNMISTGDCLSDLGPYYSNTIAKNFDEFGGVTLVERLQNHQNKNIHNYSRKILERYFQTQEIINN